MRPLRILTWHVHGSYLWYLSHVPHQLFLPVKPGRPEGYGGRGATFPWPENVHEVAADEVRHLAVDCILTQSHRNWTEDREEILSSAQRALPTIHLEHDPPRESPNGHPPPRRRSERAARARDPFQRPDVGQRTHVHAGD